MTIKEYIKIYNEYNQDDMLMCSHYGLDPDDDIVSWHELDSVKDKVNDAIEELCELDEKDINNDNINTAIDILAEILHQ